MMTTRRVTGLPRCTHQPPCPPATATDRLAAIQIAAHPEQGWSLLCNAVIVFDDSGAIAAGQIIAPRRTASSPTARTGPRRAA